MHKDQVVIRTPCGVEWQALSKRVGARFCGECSQLVHDLSALSERDAQALLQRSTSGLCVRYLYDATGRIHFADSERPIEAARLVSRRTAALKRAGGAALLAAPLLMQACGGNSGGFATSWPPECELPSEPSTAASADAAPADAGTEIEPAADPCLPLAQGASEAPDVETDLQ